MMHRTRIITISLCLSLLAVAQNLSSGGPNRISGMVVNALTGDPVGGARLELAPTSGAQWVRSVMTGRDGKFLFERLAEGKYALYAERAGFPRQGFDEHPGGFLSAIVTGPNIDSGHLVFRLQPGAGISGIVSDDYNEAVRGAQVFLFNRTIRNGRLGTYGAGVRQTDDRGFYKFYPLMPGTYYVVVSARPWYSTSMRNPRTLTDSRLAPTIPERLQQQTEALDVAYPLTFYDGATDQENATAIHLKTGDAIEADIGMRAVPAATINFRVGAGPPPYLGMTQSIFDGFEVPVASATQEFGDRSGYMDRRITGIAPGRYLVKMTTRTEGKPSVRSQILDLRGDTTLDADSITGAASASITGLAGVAGVEIQNAILALRDRDTGRGRAARIEPDGKFTVNAIPPGKYEVSVMNQSSLYLVSMAASNAKVSDRTIEIPSGADVQMAVLLSKGVGEVQGTAVRDDKPVSGAMIVLVPEDPQRHRALFRRDQSDSDGTFSLKQVVPGQYTLVAIQNGWDLEWMNPAVLKGYLGKGKRIQAEPGGHYSTKVTVQ